MANLDQCWGMQSMQGMTQSQQNGGNSQQMQGDVALLHREIGGNSLEKGCSYVIICVCIWLYVNLCVCMYVPLLYTIYVSLYLYYTPHTHIHTQGHISHESMQTCIQEVAPSHGWNPVIRLDKVHLYRYGWYCYKLLVISSYIYQPSFFKTLLVLADPDCWTLLLEDPLGWRCMVALSRYAELPSPNHLRSYATHAERGEPERIIKDYSGKRNQQQRNWGTGYDHRVPDLIWRYMELPQFLHR